MKHRFTEYAIIIAILVTYSAIFKDYFTLIIVTPIILLISISLNMRADRKRRNEEMTVDRKGLMQEVMAQAKQYRAEDHSLTHNEALRKVKTTGVWDKLMAKFRKPTTVNPAKPPPKTPKEAPKRGVSQGWAFEDDEQPVEDNSTPIAVVNEKGREYAALVKRVLNEGNTNWNLRLEDLTTLQAEMETTVNSLHESWKEIAQERKLVRDIAKLKNRAELP